MKSAEIRVCRWPTLTTGCFQLKPQVPSCPICTKSSEPSPSCALKSSRPHSQHTSWLLDQKEAFLFLCSHQ